MSSKLPYASPRVSGPFGDVRTQRAAIAAAKHEARAELLTEVIDVVERHQRGEDVAEEGDARDGVLVVLRKWQQTSEREKTEAIEEFVRIIQQNLKGAGPC